MTQQQTLFDSRWTRIRLAANDGDRVLLTHINTESLREAFKALEGTKALSVETRNHTLKSPVREIRMRGSVRVLSFTGSLRSSGG